MKIIYTCFTIILIILWYPTAGNAQVVADFNSNVTTGCTPLFVNFQDQSTGNIVWRNWDFGNSNSSIGNNSSPDNIYIVPGLYTVTLTVSDGIDTSSITKTAFIQSLVAPTASFNYQPVINGCAVFPFSVTDASTFTNAPITAWSWDFDDGTGSVSGQNVTHNYVSGGVFSVTLTVTDNQGCSASFTEPNLVTVDAKPIASFTSQGPVSACAPPLTVNLINTSSGTPPLTYNWNVGGTPFNTTNVSTTITQSGGYNVQLTVSNSFGCTESINFNNFIYIGAVQAAINIPDTVCPGVPATMNNSSLGGNTFSWTFGDGSSDVGTQVTHAYANPGNYTVTMIASAGVNCDDTVTKVINVELVTAAFTSTPHYACEAPLTVNFTDQSIGNIAFWNWHFGSVIGPCPMCVADTSILQNPTNDYLTAGYFNDTLTVTSYNGCTSTVVVLNNEQIEITQADFIPDVIEGCAPLTVNFNNITTPTVQIGVNIWDFDDGSAISNVSNPIHTFTTPGEYTVQLQVISVTGCTTLFEQIIRVGSLQTAAFGIDTIIACGSDSVGFINYSTDTNLIDEYFWDFGDGTTSGDIHPLHVFQDTGVLNITLVVGYNGCRDTLIIDSMIQILGPIITFGPIINCDTPNLVGFFANAKGGTDFYWNFGDSTAIDSVNWQITHLYPPIDANYDVTLFMSDSLTGCSQEKTQSVHVRFLEGVLLASDTNVCKDDQVYLNTNSSVNALGSVSWGFNTLSNLAVGNSTYTNVFGQNGVWDIYAIVNDENGCSDTLVQTIRVYKPIPDFSGSPITGCSPLPVQFVDNSTSDTNIVSWHWKFGDGTTSNLQNPLHLYSNTNSKYYDVELTVTDTFGCLDWKKEKNYIFVQNPPSFFKAINPENCEGDSVVFYAIPMGNTTYFWDFGDGTTSALINPKHAYAPGIYTVSLMVTNAIGCDSTFVRTSYIEVQPYPTANFTANPTSSSCYPTNVVFTDSSISQSPASWTWNFGDSPNFVLLNVPVAQNLYVLPGIYNVTLVVTTTFGCSDTITKPNFIDIGGPTANILFNPSIGCVGEFIDFDLNQLNTQANHFVWGFGDGWADTTYSPNPEVSHMYTNPGYYSVILLYSDSLGLCNKIDTVIIEVDEVVADYIRSDTTGCTPLTVNLFSQSIGEDNWKWVMDGNFSSNTPADSALLSIPGFHDIELTVWSSSSQCADTITKTVEVFPLPNINAGKDVVVCIGSSVQLHANGAESYIWSPNIFLNDSVLWNPVSTPVNDIMYSVSGIDTNGCVNSDSVLVEVQYLPELLLFPMDTSIFNGEEYDIRTVANMPLIYNWTPPVFLNCSDCSSPTASPTGTTTFRLTYSDINGCFTYDTAFVIEVSDELNINIPNAFTPNWDGTNDTFKPITYGIDELVYMRIFDRWGVMVYETDDLNKGWDGRVKGEIAAHNTVFTYSIKVRRYNGDEKDFIGMVVLISK